MLAEDLEEQIDRCKEDLAIVAQTNPANTLKIQELGIKIQLFGLMKNWPGTWIEQLELEMED